MFIFKVTEPSSIPYRTHSACAKMAAYPDPPPVIPLPESIAAQAAYQLRYKNTEYCSWVSSGPKCFQVLSCHCFPWFLSFGPGIEPKTPGCVCFITAGPITKMFAWAGGGEWSDEFLTGELFLPWRTVNQYLARYWFTVRQGKNSSPVRNSS